MKNKTTTSAGILHEIANIQNMERGKLCVIKQGKDRPYYNLQYRENGKPVCRYVPCDQVEAIEQDTENYRTFNKLVGQYAQTVIERTREERLDGQKKRRQKISANARRKKSST